MSDLRSRSIFEFDIVLFLAMTALVAIGVAFIYSSGVTAAGARLSSEYVKQSIWAGIGLVLLFSAAAVNYRRLKDVSLQIYLVMLLLLLVTAFFGRMVFGARRWLGIWQLGIQPSEFAKLALIVLSAKYLEAIGPKIATLRGFVLGLALTLPPMLLVLLQPDLGTAMVYIPIYLCMAFLAGAKLRHIVFVVLGGALLTVFAVAPYYETYVAERHVAWLAIFRETHLLARLTGSMFAVLVLAVAGLVVTKRQWFYWVAYGCVLLATSLVGSLGARMVLRPYQVTRLLVFMNPNLDPRGAGWNTIQSITAVGSGGVTGKGFMQGTQTHFQYLPQQSTDFIFSIVAEEWGFLGSLAVFALFGVVFVRGLFIVAYAREPFGSYLAVGVVALLFFHFAVNIGMAIGVMPITGIPLYFLSYGGSPLITGMIGVGLLLSIYNRKYR